MGARLFQDTSRSGDTEVPWGERGAGDLGTEGAPERTARARSPAQPCGVRWNQGSVSPARGAETLVPSDPSQGRTCHLKEQPGTARNVPRNGTGKNSPDSLTQSRQERRGGTRSGERTEDGRGKRQLNPEPALRASSVRALRAPLKDKRHQGTTA